MMMSRCRLTYSSAAASGPYSVCVLNARASHALLAPTAATICLLVLHLMRLQALAEQRQQTVLRQYVAQQEYLAQ